jgi:cation diffusion facilitator CzcD-associated flavoprotein CzcO
MDTDILVIGAGPAGLAAAAALVERGRRPLLIEKGERVGASWRGHYERLHLHTVKELSALPGLPFPASDPRYVPRQRVVDYLEAYAARAAIAPRFGVEATAIVPVDGGGWRTTTRAGATLHSRFVVVGSGANNVPFVPTIEGQEGFAGEIVHSRGYRNAAPFAGRRVLVVGMGNTGAEIALDLAEQQVAVALSVRSPVNVVHRDVLGQPTQKTTLALWRLPPALGDAIARWLCDVTVGDLGRYGLRRSAVSPLRDLREHGRTAVIDVGTLARIKAGAIAVYPGIDRLDESGARFVDGRHAPFDGIILATGYRSGIAALLPQSPVPLDESGLPCEPIGRGALAGVCFVGFDMRQPGALRTIAQQAGAVATAICAAEAAAPVPTAM